VCRENLQADDTTFEITKQEAARRMTCSIATVSRRLCGKGRKRGREILYREADVAREDRYSKNSRLVEDTEFCRLLGVQTYTQLNYLRNNARRLDLPAFPPPARWSYTRGRLWYYLDVLEYVGALRPIIAAFKGEVLEKWGCMGCAQNIEKDEKERQRRREAASSRLRARTEFYEAG
jgi:hypothetical protein